ncbi:MAG: hypothetical protein KF795_20065 [Labilithrix sp.]|nr:hypothetical protein [Labilithrix sp.]
MGAERLSGFVRVVVAALATATVGCGATAGRARPVAGVTARPRHVDVVHAMTTPARRALVDRLRDRNPAPLGSRWIVNEEALSGSLTVVDPFAGFLRRARREITVRAPREGGALSGAAAAESARAFVKRNADLLGLPRHVVPALAERVRAVEPADHAPPRAAWAVRFDASFASKGYEAFKEIDNAADVEVFVDDDGEVSSFVNLSRIHPHLTIDTRPALSEDDPRLLAKLVGRRLFALDARALGGPPRPVRELPRIPLGQVRADDVTHVQLVIHVATGPALAWLTYRLAYFIEIAKPVALDDDLGGVDASGAASPPQFHFFRWVVDADTGDVLEDARPPIWGAVDDGP